MIPIITTTYHQYEKYCDCLIDFVNQMWPGHPPIWLITDRGNIKYKQTICVDSQNWVYRLQEGLKQVKNLSLNISYVYLILEDLYPLWRCNPAEITKIQNLTLAHNLDCVSFIPYDWGKSEDFLEIAGKKLFKVPQSFYFYNQIQPALWKLNHLTAMCELALEKGINDCWEFEHLVSSAQHYVAEYRWPTIWGGFKLNRYVNLMAIMKIELPAGRRLAGMLLGDFMLESFYRIKRKIYKLFKDR